MRNCSKLNCGNRGGIKYKRKYLKIFQDTHKILIGTEFFKRLNIWAEESKVVRLELTVICENESAKHLYTNSGFEIEGIKRKSVCVDGTYLDEYYMARVR